MKFINLRKCVGAQFKTLRCFRALWGVLAFLRPWYADVRKHIISEFLSFQDNTEKDVSFATAFTSHTESEFEDDNCASYTPGYDQAVSLSTPKSMYQPSEESEMSSPCVQKSPREKLNEYLSSRDISPIRNTLLTPWEKASDRTKRLHLRKAQQVVHTCLEEITPGESAELFRYLHKRFETGSNDDCSLMEALLECYNNAGHWSSH